MRTPPDPPLFSLQRLLSAPLALDLGPGPASRSPPPLAAQRTERPALNITGYVIDAEIDSATHHLAAKTTGHLHRPANP
jgi:hypothetical protein